MQDNAFLLQIISLLIGVIYVGIAYEIKKLRDCVNSLKISVITLSINFKNHLDNKESFD